MKLQDYIHYYFGCEFIANGKRYRIVRIDQLVQGIRESSGGTVWNEFNPNSIKPILRKLDDITNDEWLEIENEISIIPDAIGWHGIKESFMTMGARHRWHWTITNEALIILRKRGIDVDQLIKNGLAIDSKTLK
jgi:hypothetical protein